MKKISIIISILVTAFVIMGCGSTIQMTMKDYVAKSQNYWSKTSTNAYASVTIDDDTGLKSNTGVYGAIATTVNIANSVAASAIEHDQGDRLHRIINPLDVADMVTVGFDENFVGNTHLRLTSDNQTPDLRIFLDVVDYGLYARSAMDAMQFYVAANIRVVYAPELTTIYNHSITASRTASDLAADIVNMAHMTVDSITNIPELVVKLAGLREKLNALSDVVSIASGIASMSAFFQLTDDDIVTMFQYMSYDAGHAIASDLVRAIYD